MKKVIMDKKSAILKAALELFTELGVHETPMSQIAIRANIGVGTIYRYYKSKQALIKSLYMDIHARMIPYIRKDFSEGAPVHDSFLLYFSNFIRYLIKHPAELSLIEQYENHPRSGIENDPGSSDANYSVIFKRALEEKLLKKLPLEMLGAIIMGMVISLTKFFIKSGGEDRMEASIDNAVEAIWDSIKRQ